MHAEKWNFINKEKSKATDKNFNTTKMELLKKIENSNKIDAKMENFSREFVKKNK